MTILANVANPDTPGGSPPPLRRPREPPPPGPGGHRTACGRRLFSGSRPGGPSLPPSSTVRSITSPVRRLPRAAPRRTAHLAEPVARSRRATCVGSRPGSPRLRAARLSLPQQRPGLGRARGGYRAASPGCQARRSAPPRRAAGLGLAQESVHRAVSPHFGARTVTSTRYARGAQSGERSIRGAPLSPSVFDRIARASAGLFQRSCSVRSSAFT